ncbi:hypothetical protein KR084_001405 [Drosophila pseudotakahashii]|nr:hypothetical protein KR084_001405 [Drosophila pseudotakahashii]
MPKVHGETLPSGRITGGQLAEPNQFPYQVGLLLYVSGGAAWCGGTIISDRWIVTAAHCTDALTTGVDVYLGAHDRTNAKEKGQQIIFVETKNVIVHEDWIAETITNDISLIKLPVAIEFNDYIQPAKLPVKSNSYATYGGESAIASGWGKISDSATGATDVLQYAVVPIMNNSGCSPWYFGLVAGTNICIKTTGGTSTCNGDSGGPLVLNDGSNTLIGATSFGIALGCEVGWPGVFTRITSFLDWIEAKTGQIIFVETKYVIVHEDYDASNISDDISLIKLPVPIEFNDYIQPAKLPVKSDSYSTYEDETALASGWGKISDSATGVTDLLQFIEVPIMSNTACNRWFFGLVLDTNICIKTTGGTSTCNGDSGGPLVLKDGTLIGATSFGISLGCEVGWPGAFTRITSYLDWIEKHSGVVNYGN